MARRPLEVIVIPGSLPFHVQGAALGHSPWRVIAGGNRTGGAVSVGDAHMPPHGPGPGRHVHTREDEAIYVVSGVLTVEVGAERFEAGPQSLVWLPRHVPHVFANLSAESVWTVGVLTPSGLEGLFLEQADYFANLTGPPDETLLLEMSERYGVLRADGPLLR
jgi:mannose-6-phosphate isomerase-like protein (cupin superfamily)